ncbi:MAG: hypothetical protein KatS3mg051_0149 [Anaerolineae bacterium]|nr:MAG: hypothetical protein KatS3mg051_0149 [Anaerolineae bacterium]
MAAHARCSGRDRLEQALDTPARIYYKYEGVSPAGSHKPNTAVAQAYYNKLEGTRQASAPRPAPGSGASSLAMACAFFGLEIEGLHGARSAISRSPTAADDGSLRGHRARQPQQPEPTPDAPSWRKTPDSPGSLGIAISEAVEDAVKNPDDTKYSLGSVLNHVLLHQTIIGEEALLPDGRWPTIIPMWSSAVPAAAATWPG